MCFLFLKSRLTEKLSQPKPQSIPGISFVDRRLTENHIRQTCPLDGMKQRAYAGKRLSQAKHGLVLLFQEIPYGFPTLLKTVADFRYSQ